MPCRQAQANVMEASLQMRLCISGITRVCVNLTPPPQKKANKTSIVKERERQIGKEVRMLISKDQ